jgi:hypothetical protein
MLNAASRVLCAAIAGALLVCSARANAAMVSGVYTSRGGAPLAGHQLHFENQIGGDIYLARTGSDGSFSTDLPPGTYDLRAERGFIVKAKIVVDGDEISVGRVTDAAPLDVRRPFEREGLAPSLLDTGAPATAHLTPPSAAAQPSAAAWPAQSTASVMAPTSQGPLTVPPPSAR